MHISSLSLGFSHFSSFITDHHRDREVFAWGLGNVGQLGDGGHANSAIPLLVNDMTNKGVTNLTCSQAQIFAVCTEGAVYTWGMNSEEIYRPVFDDASITSRPKLFPLISKKRFLDSFPPFSPSLFVLLCPLRPIFH